MEKIENRGTNVFWRMIFCFFEVKLKAFYPKSTWIRTNKEHNTSYESYYIFFSSSSIYYYLGVFSIVRFCTFLDVFKLKAFVSFLLAHLRRANIFLKGPSRVFWLAVVFNKICSYWVWLTTRNKIFQRDLLVNNERKKHSVQE